MRNVRYIGTKPSEDAFSRDTGIVWFPSKVDTVLSDEIAERMLRHPEFQDAGDAKGVSGVADTDVPTPGGGGGVSEDPVTITGNTTLTWPDAQGKYYSVNSASAVALTIPSGSITDGAPIKGMNVGAGALSFVAGGGESIVQHAILPSTVDQYSPFELRRFGLVWVRVA